MIRGMKRKAAVSGAVPSPTAGASLPQEQQHRPSSEARAKAPASPAAAAAPLRCCVECGASSTPQWREGPEGPKTLCNACGVRRQRQLRRQQQVATDAQQATVLKALPPRKRAAEEAVGPDPKQAAVQDASVSGESSDETELTSWGGASRRATRAPAHTHTHHAPRVAAAARVPAPSSCVQQQPRRRRQPQPSCPSSASLPCSSSEDGEEHSAACDLLYFAGVDYHHLHHCSHPHQAAAAPPAPAGQATATASGSTANATGRRQQRRAAQQSYTSSTEGSRAEAASMAVAHRLQLQQPASGVLPTAVQSASSTPSASAAHHKQHLPQRQADPHGGVCKHDEAEGEAQEGLMLQHLRSVVARACHELTTSTAASGFGLGMPGPELLEPASSRAVLLLPKLEPLVTTTSSPLPPPLPLVLGAAATKAHPAAAAASGAELRLQRQLRDVLSELHAVGVPAGGAAMVMQQ